MFFNILRLHINHDRILKILKDIKIIKNKCAINDEKLYLLIIYN